MQRVYRIRDIVLEHGELRSLVSAPYIENKLGCTHSEAEHALSRALQLYPDMKVMKLFGLWRYYYHEGLGEADLNAAGEMNLN